ncbi:MAG: HesA/MoeB/ThiF family protein [Candidatus Sulfobium sp.]
MQFTEEELKRYNRQMMIEGWGFETQKKLKNSTVFIAGAGGLGSPVSIYLAVAGVGDIRICDFDSPDWSNLNRQILHNHNRIGTNKALSAKQTLEEMNPHINISAFPDTISAENVDQLVEDADLIVDCMDNFPTRYLLNQSAIRKNIPIVHGSVWGLEGRLTFIHSPETPCLRCFFPESPPKEVFPILGATPGVIGTLQAVEAIKYLTGIGKLLKGKLLVWSGVDMSFRIFNGRKDPNCPTCGKK